MRRLARILYRVATAISLLLCLAAAGVWVRSGWVRDSVRWDNYSIDGYNYDVGAVRSSNGGLQFSSLHCAGLSYFAKEPGHLHYSRGPASTYPLYDRSRATSVRGYGALGFEVILEARGDAIGAPRFWVDRTLTIPLYAALLLFALLPAQFIRRHLRVAGRRARGCCVRCGYDLRASLARCPECGTAPQNSGGAEGSGR